GVIAYEIAKQLIGENQDVEFLGLFDTYWHSRQEFHGIEQRLGEDKIKGMLLDICGVLESPYAEPSAIVEMDFETLLHKCREFSLLPDFLSDLTVEETRRFVARSLLHMGAWVEYSAQPIPIPIHLFAAGTPDAPSQDPNSPDPLRGWGSVLSRDLIRVI